MSWLSNYLKNIKEGFNVVKDEGISGVVDTIKTNQALNNPVTYQDKKDGKVFGYSSAEEESIDQNYLKASKSGSATAFVNAQKAKNEYDQKQALVNTLQKQLAQLQQQQKSSGGSQNNSSQQQQLTEQLKVLKKNEQNKSSSSGGSRPSPFQPAQFNIPEGGSVMSKKDAYKNTGPVSEEDKMLSTSQASSMLRSSGLDGIIKPGELSGMYASQAAKYVSDLKAERQETVTQNTTALFDPATLNKTKNILDDFQFKLKDITSDGWNSKGTVEEKTMASIAQAQNKIASLFETSDEFKNAYATNLDFKNSVDKFQSFGGDINKIESEIKPTPTITDQFGDANIQDLQTYLSIDDATELKAFESLIPEGELAMQQIQEIAQIPKDKMSLYMGTPEQIGIYEEKRLQAQEAQRILEKEAANAEDNLKQQAELQKRRYQLQYEENSAQIEENRLIAKNYMTGMLAKLGALKTTGAAPQALGNIEQKYRAEAMRYKNDYEYNVQVLDIKLDSALDEIDTDLDNSINKLESNLTLEKEDIYNEIFKLQQAASDDTYKVLNSFSKTYRTQLEKYKKSAQSAAEKNIKDMYKTVAKYDVNGVSSSLGMESGFDPSMTFQEFLDMKAQSPDKLNRNIDKLRAEYEGLKKENIKNLSEEAQYVINGDFDWDEAKKSVKTELLKAGYKESDFEKEKKTNTSNSSSSSTRTF